jgi:4-aminobutyrate aminotransferase-like enzyme
MNQKYTVTKLPHITVTKETEEEKLLEKAEESEDSGEMEIMTEEERIHKEREKVINTIRREEFGIGIELNEDGQRLKKVQDERLGRSLDRLSKDLYSKDTHL